MIWIYSIFVFGEMIFYEYICIHIRSRIWYSCYTALGPHNNQVIFSTEGNFGPNFLDPVFFVSKISKRLTKYFGSPLFCIHFFLKLNNCWSSWLDYWNLYLESNNIQTRTFICKSCAALLTIRWSLRLVRPRRSKALCSVFDSVGSDYWAKASFSQCCLRILQDEQWRVFSIIVNIGTKVDQVGLSSFSFWYLWQPCVEW